MPEETTVIPAAPQAPAAPAVNYSDFDLDKLFAEPDPSVPPQPPQPAPAVPNAPAPQAPSQPEFFLDAGTSKYKTREEAARGYAEKDAAIAKLRQYAIDKTGVDPLTGKAVEKPAAQTTEPVSYLKDGKKYVEDLVAALQKPDGQERYAKIQQKYFEEIAGQMLSPYIPVVRDAAKVRAIEEVSQKDTQFRAFLGSEDYKSTLEAFPDIKISIEQAEADPRFADRLPSFYRLAHTASLGLKAQEAASRPPTPPVQPANGLPAPPVRPTAGGASLTPPPTAGTPTATRAATDELLRTPAGRRQIIEQAQTSGAMDFKF